MVNKATNNSIVKNCSPSFVIHSTLCITVVFACVIRCFAFAECSILKSLSCSLTHARARARTHTHTHRLLSLPSDTHETPHRSAQSLMLYKRIVIIFSKTNGCTSNSIYSTSSNCTRREFLREILYKNIAIVAIQHGKFILLTPLAIFPILEKFTQVRLANFRIHISANSLCGG